MPLEHSSSKDAFKRNVTTLMHDVGKSPHVQSQKQALAIAYATQRRGRADGGHVNTAFMPSGLSNYDLPPAERVKMGFSDVGGNQEPNAMASVTPNHMTSQQGGDMLAAMLSRKENPSAETVDMVMPVGYKSGGGIANYDIGGGVDPVNAVIQALNAGESTAGSGSIGASNPASPSAAPAATSGTSASSAAPAAAPTSTAAQAPASVVSPTNNISQPAPATPTPTAPANPAAFASPSPAAPVVGAPSTSTSFANPTPTVPSPSIVPGGTGFQNGIANPPAATTPLNTSAALLADGGVANRAGGGGFNMASGPSITAPWQERGAARSLHVGPVLSNVPGRTDNHQVSVPAGSYVLPAAHMSSMGHGNTNAGMSIASKMFGQGPYGSGPTMKVGGGHGGLPHPPKISGIAALSTGGNSDGGARGDDQNGFDPVPVDISGGEYVIPPQEIIRRWGSLKNGHAVLDQFVMNERAKEIKTQKALPPPAKE